MRLLVEFETDAAARRAYAELEATGFRESELRIDHPFEQGTIVSVEASSDRLLLAVEVLRRHELDEASGLAAH